jgi:inositol-pentakisphosphate 2-kinase
MAVCLSETSPTEWKYISEGGATIVFSYQGPSHPILTGKVLRLSKAPHGGNRSSLGVSYENSQLVVERQQKVISRLLNPSYLVDLQVVPLEAQWIETFAIYHESSRPQERKSISIINCASRTGVLAPDLIGGLSCAVEIKVNRYYHPVDFE